MGGGGGGPGEVGKMDTFYAVIISIKDISIYSMFVYYYQLTCF